MIRKFEYTDTDGVKKEAAAYSVDSYTYESLPDSPVLTGPDGKLSPSVIPSSGITRLTVVRMASEEILKGQPVYVLDNGEVGLADPSDVVMRAFVLGVAISEVTLPGEFVEIMLLGVLKHSDFSVFSPHSIIFLGEDGSMTDIRPTQPTRYITVVGRSLGNEEVLISIEKPIATGA